MKYICTACGTESLKWSGKCPSCGQWGTLEESEELPVEKSGTKIGTAAKYESIFQDESKAFSSDTRISTGYTEVDRVLGTGLIPGEVVLISGEPGIGKSTLLMQVVLKFSEKKILYVCGEESPGQLNSRLVRLANNKSSSKIGQNFMVTEDICAENIVALIEKENFDLIVVDSIQSISSMQSRSYPGSISQVRICGAMLTHVAKIKRIPMFIVGQINKGGDIAGPKVLEHIVDCVLYLEGDQFNQYRILRGMKNRFGSTNEIGVFEMTGSGLQEVGNPSLVFLENDTKSSGSAIGAVLQGSRVVFVEVQSLVVERESTGGPMMRVANGIKKPRLDMLCAVMSRKGGVFLGDKDVFVNIVGGLNINDPCIDLAICAAIKSSAKDKVLDKESVYVGEVGLTGEVRGSWGVSAIIDEAQRVGYKSAIIGKSKLGKAQDIAVKKISQITSI
ncbi:MAG: repair protein radA protein [candidate division WS6 bacterium GW2011_GWC2_36_7]|uniref:DNA repair protein RadA n=1 Tax=candidate division WS6 bacterium GW2011_GWC2_36_7 TaxID=1619091 RepID=A0A0G0EXW8_9BACT|nr:MAG: repair protein radA protein [candidate division WS6 bacterium GW2011_GWC2_36_7]